MKLIDKKGKLFGIINIIDLCVIVLVLAMGAGVYYKFVVSDMTSKKVATEPISYTFNINKIRDYFVSNVKEGDLLFDKTSGNCIGKIVKIETVPCVEAFKTLEGTYVMSAVENRINATLTIETDATVSSGNYFINRTYEIVANSIRPVCTKYFEGEGRIGDIIK